MARGFLSGAILGTLVSVGGLGAVSVLAPDRVTPPTAAVQEPATTPVPVPVEPVEATTDSAQSDTQSDTQAAPAAPQATETATAEPTSPVPEADTSVAVDPDTSPVIAPTEEATEAGGDSETAPDTAQEPQTPATRPSNVTPVTPDAEPPALDTPATPQDAQPADTAAAPIPVPETGEAIASLDAPATGDAPNAPATSGRDATPGSAAAPALTAPQGETDLSVSTDPAQPPAPAVPPVEPPLVPAPDTTAGAETSQTPEQPAESSESNADSAAPDRPAVRRLVPTEPDATTESDATASAALRPAIGTPAASLTDRNPGNSSRLPSITGTDDTTAAPDTATASGDATLPPLQRFAASVESDPTLPRMSIVMIDDGTGPLGPDSLGSFPFPVTFALDPAQPDAAARMAGYRALGYEVAALVGVPEAAQPTDVEQILAGALAALPEAVALIEAPGEGLQASRSVTEQTASFVADSGHGLVFLPNGLNTAQALAQRENVPTLSILRDFDGDGQDARTKRRFLDGAAFRARQDGAVVMLGRLTPDTLSALVLWSLQDRASSVSMVPVSTLLLEQSN